MVMKEIIPHQRHDEVDHTAIVAAIESAERIKFKGRSKDVAAELGITPAAYSSRKSRILQGKVTLKKLKELESVLGVKLTGPLG